MLFVSNVNLPMQVSDLYKLIEIPEDIRRRLHLRTQARIELPAPENLLVEGTVLYVARPPGARKPILQDEDVKVLFDKNQFDRRMRELESAAQPDACRMQDSLPKKHCNARQRKSREIVAQKERERDNDLRGIQHASLCTGTVAA